MSITPFGVLHQEHFNCGYSFDFNASKIGKTGMIYKLSVIHQVDLEKYFFSCLNYY